VDGVNTVVIHWRTSEVGTGECDSQIWASVMTSIITKNKLKNTNNNNTNKNNDKNNNNYYYNDSNKNNNNNNHTMIIIIISY